MCSRKFLGSECAHSVYFKISGFVLYSGCVSQCGVGWEDGSTRMRVIFQGVRRGRQIDAADWLALCAEATRGRKGEAYMNEWTRTAA